MTAHVGATTAPNSHGRTFSFVMTMLLIASFFSAAMAMTGTPARVSAQPNTSLGEAVPAGSVLFMEADLDQSSDQWLQVYELLERAGLSDLAQQELSVTPQQVGEIAETFEVTGRAALVFTSPEAFTSESVDELTGGAADVTTDPMAVASGNVPEGFAVVVQPDNPDALYEQFQTMLENEADEAGSTVETIEYNGTTIEYWESLDGYSEPTAIALIGDTVVLAVRPNDVEPIIDSVNGDVDTLASDENFTNVRDAFDAESIVFGYMDTTVIFDQLVAEEPDAAQFLEGQEVHLGWNVWADDAGFRLDTVTFPADGSSAAQPSTFDPTMAERFSANSLMFLNGNDIAGSGLSDVLGSILQAAFAETGGISTVDTTGTPVAAMATPTTDEVFAQLEGLFGFNLKTDLLDQLDGEFAMAANVEQVFSDSPMIDVVFVADVADEVTVEDVATKLTYILNSSLGEEAAVSEREVAGGTVTSMTFEDAIGPGTPLILEYGVIDGQLIIGVNEGVDNYVDGPTDVLADDPVYQQTLDALPQDGLVSVQFLNLSLLLPMIEEAALSLESSTMMVDADEACGDYATQEEAQAAYDVDDDGLWYLDMDFDGVACEDYFSTQASPEASPSGVTDDLNLLSIGGVTYVDEDGVYKTSTILLVGD